MSTMVTELAVRAASRREVGAVTLVALKRLPNSSRRSFALGEDSLLLMPKPSKAYWK
ncbi:MAG: hypothetical protein ACYTXA_31345 [Nostoc sp.]